jgi:endonuclease/exonuclease/phosphatase (EEP) superfamily protein YafD
MEQHAARFKILSFFWTLIDFAAALLMLSTVLGFLGRQWWIFDWFSYFRVQYLFVSCALILIYLVRNQRWMVTAMGIFFLLNFCLILPLYISPPDVQSKGQVYRVLLANVLTQNLNHELLSNLIAESDPDFVMLLEVNQTWLDDLGLVALGYPHVFAQPREDNFGIAIHSRYPFERSEFHRFGSLDLPSIVALVKLDTQPLIFVLSHPTPPISETLTIHRNNQMQELTTFIAEQNAMVIVAGDFNVTSWSPFFKDWLQTANLWDSRHGFGVQPTWPTRNWWIRVPIDHILVSPGIIVHFRAIGPDIGSDHFPVILDYSLAE